MARYKNGINGSFKGKVGSVIGCKWKGMDYMRSLPKVTESRPLSDAELANRKKFAAVHFWLQPITPFVRIGFKNYSPTVQGFVAAKSYLIRNAIAGNFFDYIVDPSLALVSYGDLPGAVNPSFAFVDNSTIEFSWTAGKNQDGSEPSDLAMLLAYDTLNKESFFDTSAAKRKTGAAVLEISNRYSSREIELYLGFISEDRERISNSQYLGGLKL